MRARRSAWHSIPTSRRHRQSGGCAARSGRSRSSASGWAVWRCWARRRRARRGADEDPFAIDGVAARGRRRRRRAGRRRLGRVARLRPGRARSSSSPEPARAGPAAGLLARVLRPRGACTTASGGGSRRCGRAERDVGPAGAPRELARTPSRRCPFDRTARTPCRRRVHAGRQRRGRARRRRWPTAGGGSRPASCTRPTCACGSRRASTAIRWTCSPARCRRARPRFGALVDGVVSLSPERFLRRAGRRGVDRADQGHAPPGGGGEARVGRARRAAGLGARTPPST